MYKIMTMAELSKFTESELQGLFREASEQLVISKENSCKRRNALASMENINRQRVQSASNAIHKRCLTPGAGR